MKLLDFVSEDVANLLYSKLQEFEGFRPRWYKPKGEKNTNRYTIGYGHTRVVSPSQLNAVISPAYAFDLLRFDVDKFLNQLYNLLGDDVFDALDEYQIIALLSFVYNLGIGAFKKSSIYTSLVRGRFDLVSDIFSKYVYSGRTRLRGLVTRRDWERSIWLGRFKPLV